MHWHPIDTAPKDGTTILLCHEKTYDMNGFAPIGTDREGVGGGVEAENEKVKIVVAVGQCRT